MKDLKIGMIGLDTSHCNAFTKYLNAKRRKNRIKGGKVRYGFPGGSEKFSKSHSRVDKFTFKLATQYSVEILESIEDVAEKSDALLLESCDGRQHLEQFSRIASYKKPVFIDKPLACSYSDAKEIANISNEEGCPFFSASSLRYYSGISDCLSKKKRGLVASIHAFGPVDLLDDYPGYYWYGVHIASIIYSLMGTGCINVKVSNHTDLTDSIVANWKDDRTAQLTGMRLVGGHDWGADIYLPDKVLQTKAKNKPPGYKMLLKDIVKFFKTGKSPIEVKEMVEIMAFLEAINESLNSGERINLETIMKKN